MKSKPNHLSKYAYVCFVREVNVTDIVPTHLFSLEIRSNIFFCEHRF